MRLKNHLTGCGEIIEVKTFIRKILMKETIILMCTVISAGVSAQTADAKAIIEKTSQIYKQWDGMEIKFSTHIRSDKNGVSESFEGTIVMKDDKFVLTTPDMITWFNGATQWTYMLRTEEVNVSTPSGSDLQLLNPMVLLQACQKDFNVSYIGESTSANAKTAYDLALIPRKKDDVEKIEIQIEKSTSLPAKLVVTMRNDMRSVIHVKELKEVSPPDNMFTFPENEYPDVEVIDLR
jgi:outer membrane lipoprotein-sorting protein